MKIETFSFWRSLHLSVWHIYKNRQSIHPVPAYSEIICVFEQSNMDILIPTNELPCAVLYNFPLKDEIRTCSLGDYLSRLHQSQQELETE